MRRTYLKGTAIGWHIHTPDNSKGKPALLAPISSYNDALNHLSVDKIN